MGRAGRRDARWERFCVAKCIRTTFQDALCFLVKVLICLCWCFFCVCVCVWVCVALRCGLLFSAVVERVGNICNRVAQAFSLFTRLPSSNASRPSRLWPPSGSWGVRPLKSQLRLILCARQIFHSPAVHLRRTGHCSRCPFLMREVEPGQVQETIRYSTHDSLLVAWKARRCRVALNRFSFDRLWSKKKLYVAVSNVSW